MRFDAERLLALLPAVYRLRDSNRDNDRGDLRALLAVLAEQIAVVEENLDQLYDDQFIDTCADWVVPYIGALLANTPPLYDGARADDGPLRATFPDLAGPRFFPRVALRARPDVAKTIHYRNAKATLPMLEELANDVTGWAVHVVEFFERIRWNQCVRNHLRLFSKGCPDLRDRNALELLHGPFDTNSHFVDVRPPSQHDGWYEMRNVGFFVWRLRSYGITDGQARHDADWRFRANPLGLDAPLFTAPKRNPRAGLDELQVPGPIRFTKFREEIFTHRPSDPPASDFYGVDDDPSPDLLRSLSIRVGNVPVRPRQICVADLSGWPAAPPRPTNDFVNVDPNSGRIAFGDDFGVVDPADVRVSYHYGFAADLGGGPYARASWLMKHDPTTVVFEVGEGAAFDTIQDALDAWVAQNRPNAIVAIGDNRTYHETAALVLDPPANRTLAIQAHDHMRPHLLLDQPISVACGSDATVTLSGLLVEGTVTIAAAEGTLRLLHTTLAPVASTLSVSATGSVIASKTNRFLLEAAFSITGALRLPETGRGITLFDCIVDGGGKAAIDGPPGASAPPLHVERSTLFGTTTVRTLTMGSETIFTDLLTVERRQEGCARFSFIPSGSKTPRPYRCQPDLEIRTRLDAAAVTKGGALTATERKAIVDAILPVVQPDFVSRRYGDPAYAQLRLRTPLQIQHGAEDGAEMGVLCHLKQSQRENNLRVRLGEYLPFGLTPGIIYVT
ncbi:MAG: hypothetical protein QOH21_2917 [Acidobacteriota bacterium]|jgi:hypothetical protein|nr:hypothetical protein [Acidobacteriota bacterium]